jgi:hypothetical protein
LPQFIGSGWCDAHAESPFARIIVKSLTQMKEKKPNQALEPTPIAVTPRADARVAPATVVAHL